MEKTVLTCKSNICRKVLNTNTGVQCVINWGKQEFRWETFPSVGGVLLAFTYT